MHNKTLSLSEIINIAVQVVNALTAAHQNGIIHRDIKPDNIMFREDGIVKILDFGLAKLTDKPSGEIDYDQKTREQMHTRSGMILGTTNYMSPEQARGTAIDIRTDIWVSVWILRTSLGSLPFEGETTSDIIASVLRAEPAPLANSGASFPRVLEEITFKCLQKDPINRYQTADEILTKLKNFQRDLEYRARTETFEFRISDQVANEKLTDGTMIRNTADESPHVAFGMKSDSQKANSYVTPPPSYFPKTLAWIVLAFAAFSVIGVYSWSKFASSTAPTNAFNTMKLAKLTFEGNNRQLYGDFA